MAANYAANYAANNPDQVASAANAAGTWAANNPEQAKQAASGIASAAGADNPFASPQDSPGWLDEPRHSNSFAEAPPPTAGGFIGAPNPGAYGQPPSPYQPPPPPPPATTNLGLDDDRVPYKEAMALRGLHFAAVGLLSTASVIGLIALSDASTGFVAFYVFFFALVLCAFEIKFKYVIQVMEGNCGFILHTPGRSMFLFLVGFLCFSLGTWGIIAASFTWLATLGNIYIAVRYHSCCDTMAPDPQPYVPYNPGMSADSYAAHQTTTTQAPWLTDNPTGGDDV